MATIDSGGQAPGSAAGLVQGQVDSAFNALRVSIRPLDHTVGGKVLGHYRIFGQGAAGLIAAGIQGFLRYTGQNFVVVHRVYATFTQATAVTLQRIDPIACFFARGYTVSDNTAATLLSIKGQDQAMRTGMNQMSNSFTVANATASATPCSGGTKTIDDNAFGAWSPQITSTLQSASGDLYKWDALGSHPVVLQNQEGVIVQWGTTAIGTGTAILGLGYDVTEVAAF